MNETRPDAIDEGSALLARIADATALREGPDGVGAFLRAAFKDAPLPLRDLARAVRLPLPVAGAVRRELETAGLLERGGGVRLTEPGLRYCRTVLALSATKENAPPALPAGGGLDARFAQALAAMEAHIAAGPPVDVTLDQAPCTADTAIRRALAMWEAGGVEGRRIALLGDDDSMSLALPLVAAVMGGAARAITVFELDDARCRQLHEAADRHGFAVEIVKQDLRAPLPHRLRGTFDSFETDPPYTLDGMALFVRRGAESLRPEKGLPGFLSYADLAPGDQLALVRRLSDLGLATMRIRPSFNRYAGASILGSSGQLLDLRTTEATAFDGDDEPFGGLIYTGEVRPRLRRYRCRGCGAVTLVGATGAFQTVEALKEAGCPTCGAAIFSRQGLAKP